MLPWKQLEARIAKHYAHGGMGRPPYPLPAMLRVHIMQLVYNLCDPAMEDALYEIESIRRFAGIRRDRMPDETTILNFRHLLERHKLGQKLFHTINSHLDRPGLVLREGSIVDASLIAAPSSTKNKDGKRDPEMHQVKKGNREWFVAMRPGKHKMLALSDIEEAEHIKASVRAKVEHAFFYIKRLFGYSKIRYRGLAKNNNRLYVLAGLANLLRSQKYQCACNPPTWGFQAKKQIR